MIAPEHLSIPLAHSVLRGEESIGSISTTLCGMPNPSSVRTIRSAIAPAPEWGYEETSVVISTNCFPAAATLWTCCQLLAAPFRGRQPLFTSFEGVFEAGGA